MNAEVLVTADDGSEIVRLPIEAEAGYAECAQCGAWTARRCELVRAADTVPLGPCCSLLCAERRARRFSP